MSLETCQLGLGQQEQAEVPTLVRSAVSRFLIRDQTKSRANARDSNSSSIMLCKLVRADNTAVFWLSRGKTKRGGR